MDTLHHEEHNLVRVLRDKIRTMYRREDHSIGDFLLLYSIIFTGLALFLIAVATAAAWFRQ